MNNTKRKKASQYAQDYRVIISQIDKIFKLIKIDIIIEYSEAKVWNNEDFKYNRGGFLMKEYNMKSKEIRLAMNPNEIINMVPYIRNYALLVDNIQYHRGIKETI